MFIVLDNIVNPAVALSTDPFIGVIGLDYSSSSPSAQLTFTPAILASLSVTFAGKVVNRTSDMIISMVTTNQIPVNGKVTVQFPSTLVWARDIATNNLIPINTTLACYGLNTEVNNATITCKGLYSTQIVTISNIFSQNLAAGSTLIIGIQGLFAPPTTEPIDQLTITTSDNNLNSIDSQIASITGLTPQTLSLYSMRSSLTTPMGVNNNAGGLQFSFTLTDTINNKDYIMITFPAGTIITYLTTTSTITLQSATYTSSNLSLFLNQSNSNPMRFSGTQANITFIRFRAPPSIKPTSAINFTIMNNGYSKMVGSASIAAINNNYTLSVTAASTVVNVYTSYSFTISMTDSLSSSGYLTIGLDPLLCSTAAQILAITSNLSISISGSSIKSSPSTQISTITYSNQSAYQLTLSNLNTSSSNIPAQTVTVTVKNILNPLSVNIISNFYMSTFYSS